MIDTAIYWDALATGELVSSDYAGVHSLNEQRYFNLLCWTYGSNPSENQYLVDEGFLPQNRAVWCADEYQKLSNSWDRLLEPNLKDTNQIIPEITIPEQMIDKPERITEEKTIPS